MGRVLVARPRERLGHPPGQEVDLGEVGDRLVEAGYERTDQVEERGQFAIRGDILDVFGATEDRAARLELFGDEIEGIRWFSTFTQRSLGDAVGREPRPVTFVASGGLGKPPSTERLRSFLALYPALRFKLDARPDWTDEIFDELEALGCVDSIDLKAPVRRLAVPDVPIPYSRPLERHVIPQVEDLASGVRELVAA